MSTMQQPTPSSTICSVCAGTGEGRCPDCICPQCGGTGTARTAYAAKETLVGNTIDAAYDKLKENR